MGMREKCVTDVVCDVCGEHHQFDGNFRTDKRTSIAGVAVAVSFHDRLCCIGNPEKEDHLTTCLKKHCLEHALDKVTQAILRLALTEEKK
jgi:transcription termination factor NusB